MKVTSNIVESLLESPGQGDKPGDKRTTKIKRDKDWGEWVVELYVNGKHYEPADYHTDDKQDAIDTAKAMEKPITR